MQDENTGQRDSPSDGKKSFPTNAKIAIAVAVVIIIILIVVVIYLLLKKDVDSIDEETVPYSGVVLPDNVDEVADAMKEQEITPIGYYEVRMNTEWTFPDGNTPSSNAYVANKESNQYPVYFTIELADDSERNIYTSPLLTVGSELKEIQLDEPLEKGSYDCVLIYHLMDEDDNEQSRVSVKVSITVEN